MWTGEHIGVWNLQNGPYRDNLKEAIHVQNYIGWGNFLKKQEWLETGDLFKCSIIKYFMKSMFHYIFQWHGGKENASGKFVFQQPFNNTATLKYSTP